MRVMKKINKNLQINVDEGLMATAETQPERATTVEELRELMRSVTLATERLESTHGTLQTEVAHLKSELAEANEQLRRSRDLAALGEMAAGIAHEIRNPLGSIRLYVQLLANDEAATGEQNKICKKIDRAVTGLDAIVRDILLFARESSLRVDQTQSDELIARVLANCEGLLSHHEVIVLQSIDDHLIMADSGLLVQAISNVLRNAVEASAAAHLEEPVVHLEVFCAPMRVANGQRMDRVVIAVEDHGGGIPAKALGRIFNPFFTTRATGTGLGLAIVHRIVDAHGGHVQVRSKEGKGTRIELCLPPEGVATGSSLSSDQVIGRHDTALALHDTEKNL